MKTVKDSMTTQLQRKGLITKQDKKHYTYNFVHDTSETYVTFDTQ